jgi:hypothetical protein
VSAEIEVLAEITDEVLEAFGRLLPQVPSSARPIDGAGLRRLVLCEDQHGRFDFVCDKLLRRPCRTRDCPPSPRASLLGTLHALWHLPLSQLSRQERLQESPQTSTGSGVQR